MKYCKESTEITANLFDPASILVQLNELIKEEGGLNSTLIFEEETIVINGDLLEEFLAENEKRSKEKSVDVIFAIQDESSNLKIQFVEFRLNYTGGYSFRNLKLQDLKGKVDGSKKVINDAINGFFPFIFQDHLVQQAKSRLYRMSPKVPQEFVAMTLSELKNEFF